MIYSNLKYVMFLFSSFLPQYVKIDWCGFHQRAQHLLNVLDVEALLWLPLPAAQHHIVYLLWTKPGALQDPALSDTLNHLDGQRETSDWSGINLTAHSKLHVDTSRGTDIRL